MTNLIWDVPARIPAERKNKRLWSILQPGSRGWISIRVETQSVCVGVWGRCLKPRQTTSVTLNPHCSPWFPTSSSHHAALVVAVQLPKYSFWIYFRPFQHQMKHSDDEIAAGISLRRAPSRTSLSYVKKTEDIKIKDLSHLTRERCTDGFTEE